MHVLAIEEYGIRCLLQVAAHLEEGPMTAPEIARREGIGPEYAARIMGALRAGGLVVSTRGAAGGYRLSRPADQIHVWEVLRVLGGSLLPKAFCDCHSGQRRDCAHHDDCAVRALWRQVEGTLRRTLEGVSLQDLARDEESMANWLEATGRPEIAPI